MYLHQVSMIFRFLEKKIHSAHDKKEWLIEWLKYWISLLFLQELSDRVQQLTELFQNQRFEENNADGNWFTNYLKSL